MKTWLINAWCLIFIQAQVLGQGSFNFDNPIMIRSAGVEQERIFNFVEDQRGYIWITTTAGLFRYDGQDANVINFTDYKYNLPSVSSCLTTFGEEFLIFGSIQGIVLYNIYNGAIKHISLPLVEPIDPFNSARVVRVIENQDGSMWVVCLGAVHLLGPQQEVLKSYIFREATFSEHAISSSGDFFGFDLSNQKIFKFPKSVVDSTETFAMLDWLGTSVDKVQYLDDLHLLFYNRSKNYLANIDLTTRAITPITNQIQLTNNFHLKTIYLLNKEQFITVGAEQITINNLDDYSLSQVAELPKILRDNFLNSAIISASGHLFVGIEDGAFIYSKLAKIITPLDQINQALSTISINLDIIAVYFTPTDWWIGTHGSGVLRYNLSSKKISPIFFNLPEAPLQNLIWNLHAVHPDTLWVGTSSGLFWLNVSNESYGRITHLSKPPGLDQVPITTLFADSRGWIWIGLGLGMGGTCYKPTLDQFIYYPPTSQGGLPLAYWKFIAETPNRDLWMGTQRRGPLVHWHAQADSFSVIPQSISSGFSFEIGQALISDLQGAIWFSGLATGVTRYQPADSVFTHFKMEQGLSSNKVNRLFCDRDNDIWIGTFNGLNLYNQQTNKLLQFNKLHGLPDNRITFIDTMPGTGEFIIGTYHGLATFEKRDLQQLDLNSKLTISDLRINNQPVDVRSKTIILPYWKNNLEIIFTQVDYETGSSRTYAYRINQDTIWQNLGDRSQVRFAALSPGKYIFSLRVCSSGNLCTEAASALTVIIHPPFWKSLWFFVASILGVFGLSFLFFYLRYRQILQLQKIRQGIAADLHDDLGASISNIYLMAELASQHKETLPADTREQLALIKEESDAVNRSIQDIIWNINPEHDKLNDLLIRMRRRASELFEQHNIEYEFELDQGIDDVVLQAENKKDLYLILKEAINNLLKYANCSQAYIRITKNGRDLDVLIRDNGQGFDLDNTPASNGLNSMKMRAKKLKGALQIHSVPTSGTEIHLTFPIT